MTESIDIFLRQKWGLEKFMQGMKEALESFKRVERGRLRDIKKREQEIGSMKDAEWRDIIR